MNPDKSRFKIMLGQEFGNQFDDMLESAQKELFANIGARQILQSTGEKIAQLSTHVDRDLEEGKIPDEPLKIAEYVKRYVSRAVTVCHELSVSSDKQATRAEGKIEQAKASVEFMQKFVTKEKQQLDAFKAHAVDIEGTDNTIRPDAITTDPLIAAAADIQQRREERKREKAALAAAALAAKEAEQSADVEKPAEVEDPKIKAETSPKARRRRGAKTDTTTTV